MDYTDIKLGELISSKNDTIRRNAMSILKQLQRNGCEHDDNYYKYSTPCVYCGEQMT